MKVRYLLQMLLITAFTFAQDSNENSTIDSIQTHTQLFSLSPISKKVDKVNGLVFGVGHVQNRRIALQKINGINIEANPAPIAGAFMAFIVVAYLPEIIKNMQVPDSVRNNESYFKIKNFDYSPHLRLNGLNISSGCFFTTTSMNGLNISAANKFNNFNGVSITALGTLSDKLNGLSIGICNGSNSLKGAAIGVFNQSYELKGLHLGIINLTRVNYGMQLGIFNRSNSKGLQIGIWNRNNKRSLPFLNW
jgi:hypothetical protein